MYVYKFVFFFKFLPETRTFPQSFSHSIYFALEHVPYLSFWETFNKNPFYRFARMRIVGLG